MVTFRRRAAAGLPTTPLQLLVTRMVVLAVAVLVTAAVLAADRGLPLALVIFVGIVVLTELLITRTRFGRHVLAVEGPEGTDGMLRRVRRLRQSWLGLRRRKEGGVLIKAAKRGQDLRVDMPTIGPRIRRRTETRGEG